MSTVSRAAELVRHADRFFIGGEWVAPATNATIDVIDSYTERRFLTVAAADAADMARAVGAARTAFDEGPWPRMSPAERASYVGKLGARLASRADDLAELWTREVGVLHSVSRFASGSVGGVWSAYASLAESFPFEEEVRPAAGGRGLLVREPVGVVGAIIPWNGPLTIISHKVAPALLAGCTVVLKCSPEAPGEGYLFAEVAEEIGLPPGVVNVVSADREVSELLVSDPRVDKITFTGSTAAGRRIASLCGERIARYTLELGGKSAALILEDADVATAAASLVQAECLATGQVCSSLTRVIVTEDRHDEVVDALAAAFSQVRVGDPFDPATQMGPLATQRQRDRVEGYIAKGLDEGATLATGGRRPTDLDHGWFIEPTVFANVDNRSTIAQEEVFGPVLCVISAVDEPDAIRIANDTIYGLNSNVFTPDSERARRVAVRLRSGTVGHNGSRPDFGIAFGGFKQSGVGREGGREGFLSFLETKTVILER